MRAGTGTNKSWIEEHASPREDRLYTGGGGSWSLSGDSANAQEQTDDVASGKCNERISFVEPKTWFDAVENNGCVDGVCPVPWETAPIQSYKKPDVVNHPDHYNVGGIECIAAIEAQLTEEEFRGYLKGNIAKYVWREQYKSGTESLKKAQFYLNLLVKFDEEENSKRLS